MKKYKNTERKVDLYDIGNGLILMNIIRKNEEGKMSVIDTYIGAEGNGFTSVGHTGDLDKPGVLFSYSQYVNKFSCKELSFATVGSPGSGLSELPGRNAG